MSDKKPLVIFVLIFIAILALNSDFMGGRKIKTFSVTADTNVSQVKGLSKYVTQEEVDGFAFRHWNIDKDKVMNNDKMENLRLLLKSKNTQEILNYMKDNNISVDEPLHYGVTPLMYASFYDDINTAKELLNLGADPHKKDKYKLSPMAYAIENNATKSVKLLYDNGVKFDEVVGIQSRWELPNAIFYDAHFGIESIVATDGDAKVNYYKVRETPRPPFYPIYFFQFVVSHNLIEIAQMVLESGYKPYVYNTDGFDIDIRGHTFEEFAKTIDIKSYMANGCSPKPDDPHYEFLFNEEECLATLDFRFSIYKELILYPNYEPMLELLLKHNVGGQPKFSILRDKYYECYRRRASIDEDATEMKVNLYQNNCSEPSEAFKDTRALIAYLNEDYKISEIYHFELNYKDRVYTKQGDTDSSQEIFKKYKEVIGEENMKVFVEELRKISDKLFKEELKKTQELYDREKLAKEQEKLNKQK
ncbi:ankyrin repeat domain-containing protein [Campylobacter sp. VBCF_06 NA8]|uniref:ankyrin repeat domain-containing protein n=1 Tax=Campylobacter sp. VBCF_06 NA8 TaxID=2983822 RepID=UPI0022E9DA16|nr:ankyrin repeat domain-containing protein [Campylobacter sp. VBCF_06 NA8]MDA3046397.1 ankyrin repeat domain-containing protein [Campylobacter sp. VBCF_06 NA8]